AHERSLNIDLLLGYVKQLLPRRPDLKVIITSATIDTERFAQHFAIGDTPAPVIEITGRTFPVEVRYRPIGEEADDDRDQVQAVCDAITELSREGTGDVLVFLSGEREIHDTAAAVRALELPATDVLPLYARLSWAEQQRIFQPHPGRRVVLSTNVAETSITVPGVRFVVDAGTARISRYSRRLKVQRLPIERVSQASADQRAGRCGRVAPGICIRLYSQDDYESRPEFTQPEILRTNLASVILQMTSLGLGDVSRFPFVDAPDAASVRDGYVVLEELAAIEAATDGARVRRLTAIGRKLARLPIDPRLGRMVLEADRLDCVREVLVIAAALSIQDPRERPEEHRQQADELHRRFDVPGSDLLSIVALWDYIREQQRELSSNQFRRLCRAEFLNYLRVREWRDLYSQLRQVAGGLGIRPGTEHGHPDHVHRAVMAGLLSHLGMRIRDGREFAGARGSRFMIGRGSQLARRPPRWVMAAELVETDRVWARRVAAVQPEWAERLGEHLVKRTFGDPWWDADRGSASIAETVTLYGLPIVNDRSVALERVDPFAARAMFVRHALVEGEWRSLHAFVARNREFVERWHELATRSRRADVVDDDVILDFYDDRVPNEVVSARHFDRWWKDAAREQPQLLDLTDDVLGRDSGLRWSDYPDALQAGDVTLRLGYRYAPGEALDGVTAYVPLTALNQLDHAGVDWHVPGWRGDLVAGLVRTLPKEARRHLIPMVETVTAATARLRTRTDRPMTEELAAVLGDLSGVHVDPRSFRPDLLATHLRVHVVVEDDGGAVLDAGDDLDAIRSRLASATRAAIAAAVPLDERRGIIRWDVGAVPRVV
ncbi:MAG TPA: ATP-dependent RNA helicase HrpA, partial [Ilumatobacteraceae bacterium]